MSDVLPFADITDADLDRVGGKGLSLARSARAGLPVPPGFVISTDASRRLTEPNAGLIAAVELAYTQIGSGPVAVRSSAVAEDGADASFAGQQDTTLNVIGVDAIIAAITHCWKSAQSERGIAYRRSQGVGSVGVAMAVVVQRMVAADVAGVLFTRDPADPTADVMLIDAAPGLGEAVVSGSVQPDHFRVRHDGTILERRTRPTPCLNDTAVSQLVELSRTVEAEYRGPRDIEWAFANGELFLLQARPITAGDESERVRAEIIAELRAKAEPGGTVWTRYNLSEVLAEPTPMTWAVVGRLLAADGGFGLMNRDFGATPDPALGTLGGYDLVAGQPMANLSRLPRLQFARPPFEYPFAALKANPASALNPKPVLNPWRVGLIKLPGVLRQLARMQSATTHLSETFASRWPGIVGPFASGARTVLTGIWAEWSMAEVHDHFTDWTRRTLVEFAHDSLKPTVLADAAWQAAVAMLTPPFGVERAMAAVTSLAVGAAIPDEADLPNALRGLSAGTLPRQAFLSHFGHRGPNEMELSSPRWVETPDRLPRVTETPHRVTVIDPATVADEAKLSGRTRDQFLHVVGRLRTYLGLREAGKHYLLLGYTVIRRALVELDHRFDLRGGIFYLTPEELPALIRGDDFTRIIAQRRKRRRIELGLPVPAVLFSDNLETIGRPPAPPDEATTLIGIPLSSGVAEGQALVLTDPTQIADDTGFILVCSSTDPAWVPLFGRARALVMETGGVLSHGAIVAREFGLPAVAGLPGILNRVRSGDRLRVDGTSGRIDLLPPE